MERKQIEVNEPRVSVSFSRSNSKDGGRGFNITVAEGVEETEALRIMALARQLNGIAVEEVTNGE